MKNLKQSDVSLNVSNSLSLEDKLNMNSKLKIEDTLKDIDDSEYRCVKCMDRTFIIEDNVAIPCECRAVREAERILKCSGLSDEFKKKTFDNFDYARDVQTINAYKKARDYVRCFDDTECGRGNSIMFCGQVGSGKTHLSLSICNELMSRGVGVIYMGYRDVITRLKQSIMDEVYYNREIGRYKRARVLLIDDLFKGRISDSDLNIVFEILNYRYFNNLPVIVSCEKSVEELIAIDEAIGSRLVEMCNGYVVYMNGKKLNYRMHR